MSLEKKKYMEQHKQTQRDELWRLPRDEDGVSPEEYSGGFHSDHLKESK